MMFPPDTRLKAARTALARAPGRADLQQALLRMLVDLEDPDDALAFAAAYDRAPGTDWAWDRQLVRALQAAGRREEAVARVEAARAVLPDDPLLLAAHADLLARGGREDDARDVVARLVEWDRAAYPPAVADFLLRTRGTEWMLREIDGNPARFPCGTRSSLRVECLLAQGREEEARAWMDSAALMRCTHLPDLATAENPRFHDRLIAEAVSLAAFRSDPFDKATRQGFQANLVVAHAPHVQALLAAVRLEVEAYAVTLPARSPLFLSQMPERVRIEAWMVRLAPGGRQLPHTHGSAWLSGVYYLETPGVSETEGALEVPLAPRDGLDAPWGTRRIVPEPGMLLLFPSYFRHGTLPHQGNHLRTSVAFDILPAAPD